MRRLKALLTSPWLALALRLYIGGVFIYASMNKISYPGEFADTIAGYQILPWWGVNATAVVMPWLELICGAMLVIGVRTRAAALCIAAMLALFTGAIALNLLRGTPIGCGCFSSVEDEMSYLTVLRDVAWLAMTLHVFFFDKAMQLERAFLGALKET